MEEINRNSNGGSEDDIASTICHESPFPGSRLLIHSMELENFKSYAGKVKLGPFHKCFSSIVGPNGSGKSNSIDAMLFVFGKRASKLRLKKVSELIHNSTAFPNLDFASVTVHFCNIIDRPQTDINDEESYDIVKDSELEVKRVAYKNNKSDYFVNGKRKTFTEVTELLMTRGIDLRNNRFLILQGEVEQISMMKPKGQNEHDDGLLEYLEDIIGSNRYVDEIDQISEEVEKLNDSRSEKLNRVKVVEKDMESLEEAKNEAMEYLKKDKLLVKKRAWFIQRDLIKVETELEVIMDKMKSLQASIDQEKQGGEAFNERKDKLLIEHKAAIKEYKLIEEQLEQSKKDFASFQRKDIELNENLKDAKKSTKDLENMISKHKKLLQKHEGKASKVQEETIPNLEQEAENLKHSLSYHESTLEKMFESLSNETNKLRSDLEKKQKGLGPLTKEASKCKSELDIVKTEIELINGPVNQSKQNFEEAQQKLEDLKIAAVSRPKELKAAKDDLNKAKDCLKENVQNLEIVIKDENNTEKLLKNARNRYGNAKIALSQASNRKGIVSALLKAQNEKKIVGLSGRLGDLATIDPIYDIAISTACAGGLDFLVTDTSKNAESCVKYLRQNNLGRATFAILEKLKHLSSHISKKVVTPENVPRLFDLIKVKNERFSVAFYHIMRNTLVAENLEQAVRIAYQGNKAVWRVVTLDGQVIDTSGTMAGGGKRVKKGGMLLSTTTSSENSSKGHDDNGDYEIGPVSKEQVFSLEKDVMQLQNKLNEIRKEKQTLSKDKARIQQLINDLEVMIKKLEMEIEQIDEQTSLLSKNIKALENKCIISDEDQKKLDELEIKVSGFQSAFDKAQSKVDELESKTADLHAQIANIGGSKVKEIKDKIKEVETDMESNRKKITKANADHKKEIAHAKKSEKTLEEALADYEDTEKRISQLKEDQKELENEALKVMQIKENAELEAKKKKEKLEDISTKLQAEEAKCNKLAKALIDMTNQLDQYVENDLPKKKKVKNQLMSNLTELKDRYDTLKAQHLDSIVTPLKNDKEQEIDTENEINTNDDNEAMETEDFKNQKNIEEDFLEIDKEQISEIDFNLIGVEIDQLESDVTKLKKIVNMSSIKEYNVREVEYKERVLVLEGATAERDTMREKCDSLRKKRLTEFMTGFSQITLKLKEMYQMITLGGDAELELVDTCDPFSEGIVFSVRPPKKSWKNISNLSGGEKTLSSLALVFALHHYNPTPLYVLDEIDAALDFKNVSIVGNYIKERTKNAQFIIISLRNNMFELADRLVGIYKTNDATKTITINPEKVAKAAQQKAMKLQEKKVKDQGDEIQERAPLSTLNV